jgi:hypothetical protein
MEAVVQGSRRGRDDYSERTLFFRLNRRKEEKSVGKGEEKMVNEDLELS